MTPTTLLGALAFVGLVTAGTVGAAPANALDSGPKVSGKAKAGAKAKWQSRGAKAKPSTLHARGRAKSRGPAHASPRGLERASANSVLAGGRVVDGPLAGLGVGAPIHVNGVRIGTVERIAPTPGHNVSKVLVRTMSGRILPISPDSIEFEDGKWSADGLRPGA